MFNNGFGFNVKVLVMFKEKNDSIFQAIFFCYSFEN